MIAFHSAKWLLPGGFVGVDIFFVISGYLITGIVDAEVRNGTFSLVSFYERRARRILPALFFVVTATLALGSALFMPAELEGLGESAAWTMAFASNIHFWFDAGYFSAPPDTRPLLHTWSLGVEEQFYLFFPVILLLVRRLAPKATLPVIIVIGIGSFTASLDWIERDSAGAFYLIPFRAWELMIGSAVALVPDSCLPNPKMTNFLGMCGLLLIIISVACINDTMSFPGWIALAPTVGAALLIYSAAERSTLASRALSSRLLVGIGLISYSLYLWHWPVLVYARYFMFGPLTPAMTAFAVAVALCLAIGSWYWIERPFRDRRQISRTWVFALSVSGITAIGACGSTFVAFDGLPGRLLPEVNELAAGTNDTGTFHRDCLDWDASAPIKPMGKCHLGVKGQKPDFILWGDSYAASLADGVDDAANHTGHAGLLVANASCPPILGAGGWWKNTMISCSKLQNQFLGLVDYLGIHTVILHAYWQILDVGTYIKQVNSTATDGVQAFAVPFDKTIEALRKRGVNVVIVSSVPRPGILIPPNLARLEMSHSPTKIRVSEQEFLYNCRTSFDLFRSDVVRQNATVINIYKSLCNKDRCDVVRNGHPLYFDEGHLSGYASHMLAPELTSIFSEKTNGG